MVFIAVFSLIGILLLSYSQAATFAVHSEAETGAVAGNAQLVSDVDASAGGAVRFGQTATNGSGFITRQGTQLFLNGKVFRTAGFNASPMMGCGSSAGWTPNDAQRETFFSALRPGSVTRVWVLRGNDLSTLDRIIQQAKAHNTYVAITLADQGGGCEGVIDDAFYAGGYTGSYMDWINTVVPRYKNETAVAAWELANEPGTSNGTNFRNWVDASAGRIKQLDPNHLISIGTVAPYGTDGQAAESAGNTPIFQNIHASPYVDLVSLHEYDDNAGASAHFAQVLKVAQAVNKPVIVGEYAIHGSQSGVGPDWYGRPCRNWTDRTSIVRAKLNDYYSHPEVAWTTYWNFQQSSGGSCDISIGGLNLQSDPLVPLIRTLTIPNAGTVSPSPSPTPPPPVSGGTVNDTTFVYAGTWQTGAGGGTYLADDHYSDVTGSTATVNFTGTQIVLYTSKDAHHGMATISVDGGAATIVDEYAPARQDQVAVYTSPTLPAGTHTLVFSVSGTHNSASSGTTVNIDRADIR